MVLSRKNVCLLQFATILIDSCTVLPFSRTRMVCQRAEILVLDEQLTTCSTILSKGPSRLRLKTKPDQNYGYSSHPLPKGVKKKKKNLGAYSPIIAAMFLSPRLLWSRILASCPVPRHVASGPERSWPVVVVAQSLMSQVPRWRMFENITNTPERIRWTSGNDWFQQESKRKTCGSGTQSTFARFYSQ